MNKKKFWRPEALFVIACVVGLLGAGLCGVSNLGIDGITQMLLGAFFILGAVGCGIGSLVWKLVGGSTNERDDNR